MVCWDWGLGLGVSELFPGCGCTHTHTSVCWRFGNYHINQHDACGLYFAVLDPLLLADEVVRSVWGGGICVRGGESQRAEQSQGSPSLATAVPPSWGLRNLLVRLCSCVLFIRKDFLLEIIQGGIVMLCRGVRRYFKGQQGEICSRRGSSSPGWSPSLSLALCVPDE